MNDHVIDFVRSEDDYLSSSLADPSPGTIFRETLDETPSQPTTTKRTASKCIASLDHLTLWSTERVLPDLGPYKYDDMVAAFATGPLSPQEPGNADFSISPGYIGLDNLLAANDSTPSGLVQKFTRVLTSSHVGEGFDRAEPRISDTFNISAFVDPKRIELTLPTRQQISLDCGRSHFSADQPGTGFTSTNYGNNLEPQQRQQPLLARLPEATDITCFNRYQPPSKPSEPAITFNDPIPPSAMNQLDISRPTYRSSMTTDLQYSDMPATYYKRRKRISESRQLLGTEFFSCSVCHLFSGNVRSLREHMRCHERSHTCSAPGCAESFSTFRDLTRHVESLHMSTFLTCYICSASIKGNRKDNLRRHIRTRHSTQAVAHSFSPSEYFSWPGPGDYISL